VIVEFDRSKPWTADSLRDINILSTKTNTLVPLSNFATVESKPAPVAINQTGQLVSTTISFNLPDGVSLSQAMQRIDQVKAQIGLPNDVFTTYGGTAAIFQQSQGNTGLLILAAVLTIYVVLGVLYESFIHPLTILSGLPAAAFGALLALKIMGMDFSIIALIGLLMLIGIVKKNAIMIIDFALEAERGRGLSSLDAIREASMLRFRPILMTTLAAALGALPLAIGFGEGAELRQPLGIAIIGGLIASQVLTLLTTPVVYLLLDRLRRRSADEHHLSRIEGSAPDAATSTAST